jgi:hypothetical protein
MTRLALREKIWAVIIILLELAGGALIFGVTIFLIIYSWEPFINEFCKVSIVCPLFS